MPNIVITDIDQSSLIFEGGDFEDGILGFGGLSIPRSGTVLEFKTTSTLF